MGEEPKVRQVTLLLHGTGSLDWYLLHSIYDLITIFLISFECIFNIIYVSIIVHIFNLQIYLY